MTVQIKKGKLYLQISSRMQEIGELVNRTLTVNRSAPEDIDHDSYGVPYDIIKDDRFFDMLIIKANRYTYMISRINAIRYGGVRKFQNVPQLMIPIDKLQPIKK